jgi:hypothetical protein
VSRKKPPKRRNALARDLRTPKYKPRVVPSKKRDSRIPEIPKS